MKASTPMNLSEVTVLAEAETTDISFVELPCCPAAEKDAQMDATGGCHPYFRIHYRDHKPDFGCPPAPILQEAAHA